jgi:DNA-binding response OmpR family regulator
MDSINFRDKKNDLSEYKILIVEREPKMHEVLKDNLELEGYHVEIANDGEAGLEKMKKRNYVLIILDTVLSKLSGFDVCRALRAAQVDTPIILRTSKIEELDKILGFELGADDFITDRVSVREVLARVKAMLRRSQTPLYSNRESYVNIGRLHIDFNALRAKNDQKEVKLSYKEFDLLSHLYRNRNNLISRYDLLQNVWRYRNGQISTRTVDNFIVRLRQKVEVNPNQPKIILTVYGIGYKMII